MALACRGQQMVFLITGAAGRAGGYLRIRLARPDRALRLLDIAPWRRLARKWPRSP